MGNKFTGNHHVCNVVFERIMGGTTMRALRVAKELQAHGIKTTMVFHPSNKNGLNAAHEGGIPALTLGFSPIPNPRNPLKVIGYFSTLPRDILRFKTLYKKINCSIVHVNGGFFYSAMLAGLRRRLIVHFNDTITPSLLAPALAIPARLWAHGLISAAPQVSDHYKLPHNKTQIIPAPVDTNVFSHVQTRPPPTEHATIKILVIANWSPVKDVGLAVEILTAGHTSGLTLELHLVGGQETSQENYCNEINAQIAANPFKGFIHCHGRVQNPLSKFNNCHFTLISSRSEASPTVALEALAVGMPVIGTNVGSLGDMVSNLYGEPAGQVTATRSPCEFIKIVKQYIADPTRYLAAQKAGPAIARGYDVPTIAAKYKAIYTGMAN